MSTKQPDTVLTLKDSNNIRTAPHHYLAILLSQKITLMTIYIYIYIYIYAMNSIFILMVYHVIPLTNKICWQIITNLSSPLKCSIMNIVYHPWEKCSMIIIYLDWCHMKIKILVNDISDNGLLADGTNKPLPEPMLTCDYWHTSTPVQYLKICWQTLSFETSLRIFIHLSEVREQCIKRLMSWCFVSPGRRRPRHWPYAIYVSPSLPVPKGWLVTRQSYLPFVCMGVGFI